MAVLTAPGHDVKAALMAAVAVTAARSEYTITESEAVNDVILLKELPAQSTLLLLFPDKGGSIDGDLVLARSDGSVVSTLANGLTGTKQVLTTLSEDLYLAVKVTTAPAAGDAGQKITVTALYQFGEP